MRLEHAIWTYALGLLAAAIGQAFFALSWPVALVLLAGIAPTGLLLGLAAAAGFGRHEVLAVRADADFGRIALLDDGRWEGAVALIPEGRPVDVEIEAAGEGPTLAQRLAYQDARSQLAELMPTLAEACGQELRQFETTARFLCLRLPAEQEGAPDWSLSYSLGEQRKAPCWEVAVRAGQILQLRKAA